jgi:hypothetical protein
MIEGASEEVHNFHNCYDKTDVAQNKSNLLLKNQIYDMVLLQLIQVKLV